MPILWYSRCPLPSATGLALDHGQLDSAFRGTGVELRSIARRDSPRDHLNHFEHAIDWMIRQGGNIPPIWSRSMGAETALVGIACSAEYQALLVHEDSSLHTAADLAGARLALPCRGSERVDFWRWMCVRGYQAALDQAGLSLADVELVTLEEGDTYIEVDAQRPGGDATLWSRRSRARRQSTELVAFVRGEVDVIYTCGALGMQLKEQLRARELTDLGSNAQPGFPVNNQTPNLLTVDRALTRERPDLVARYIAALNDAVGWAVSHPEAAGRSVARDVGCPEDWVLPAYGDALWQSLAIGLDDDAVSRVDAQIRFLREHEVIETDVSLDDWIDDTPLSLSTVENATQ